MENSLIHVKIITGQVVKIIKREANDCIIAVDSGIAVTKRLNIIPDYLVGDLDSANESDIQWAKAHNVKIIQYPVEKDYVDTQLAINIAYQLNPHKITIYNELSGRFDHTIALVYLLLQPMQKGIKCSIKSMNNTIYLINKEIKLQSSNSYISILSFTETAKAVATGLKYQLPELLYANNPIGVSNEFIDDYIEISVKQGIILLIVSKIV